MTSLHGSAVLVGAICMLAATTARAQIVTELAVGATASSILVRDSIVQPFTVAPGVAPTLGLSVGTRLDDRYSVVIEARWARSTLARSDAALDVLPLTVWSAAVALRRDVTREAHLRATAGAVRYAPAATGREATLFRDDAPLLPAVGLGAGLARPVGPAHLGVDVAYTAHRFTTRALRADGFSGQRLVHRVTFSVSVAPVDARP